MDGSLWELHSAHPSMKRYLYVAVNGRCFLMAIDRLMMGSSRDLLTILPEWKRALDFWIDFWSLRSSRTINAISGANTDEHSNLIDLEAWVAKPTTNSSSSDSLPQITCAVRCPPGLHTASANHYTNNWDKHRIWRPGSCCKIIAKTKIST